MNSELAQLIKELLMLKDRLAEMDLSSYITPRDRLTLKALTSIIVDIEKATTDEAHNDQSQ